MTIHSFAGIKDGRGSKQDLLSLVEHNYGACQRWIDIDTLIIDEISMISKHDLVSLEYIVRKIRGNDLQYGGIQVIGSKDFFQLPSVQKVPSAPSVYNNLDIYSTEVRFLVMI